MRSTPISIISRLFTFALLVFSPFFGHAQQFEDYTPEVSARVVRVNYLKGSALVLRKESDDWEKVVMNLPLVEGDEIVSERGSLIELQLDSSNFIRIDSDSRLKLTTLSEDGVAVSLVSGTMTFKVGPISSESGFFEIDAPGTTIAIQRSGLYRVDSIDNGGRVSLRVEEGGEARVYSESAGFTIRGPRMAILHLSGQKSGEWDVAEFRRRMDGFDDWNTNRDEVIARKLRNANFDKFYDSDFYGADDLNDYGSWVDTSDYGTVWRPHRTTINVYSDWSPYRYGHWRWIPPFGWTWVNDEPWGWVTYHHGRWVYISGYWHWAPYPHPSYRWTRSWWRPAFVSFHYYGSSLCWYPLPYYAQYHDYNRPYYSRWSNRTYARNYQRRSRNININIINVPRDYDRRDSRNRRDRDRIPDRGIVVVEKGKFGRTTNPGRAGGKELARIINSQPGIDRSPVLPDLSPTDRRRNSAIIGDRRPRNEIQPKDRIGLGDRKEGRSLDPDLRKTRIFGNRRPTNQPDSSMPIERNIPRESQRPGTGVVTRPEKNIRTETRRSENAPETGNPRVRPTPDSRYPRDNSPRSGRETDNDSKDSRPAQPDIRTPRRPSPTPTPSPEQRPRLETSWPTPTPESRPRYESPRPTPESRPRYESPRPTPEPRPRYESPRQSPRNDSPRESQPQRREAPRVSVPPKSSNPDRSGGSRSDSPSRREVPSSPSKDRPSKSRDN